MLGEEGEVYSGKHDEELGLGPPLRQGGTRDRRESKRDPGEDSENGTYRKYIMEMRNDIIGIM